MLILLGKVLCVELLACRFAAQHAVKAGLITQDDITTIGAVIEGTAPGRTSDDQITLFDGTGVGLQDLAVADAALKAAIENGIAIEVDF